MKCWEIYSLESIEVNIFASKQLPMDKIENSFLSILKLKCPRCHSGNLFINKNVYQYKGFFDMPEKCPKCQQDFEIEPGFYYGAMYISYGLTIALNVAVFAILIFFNAFTLNMFFAVAGPVLLAATPYIFKVSRSVWIDMCVKYDPKALNKSK